GRDADGDVTGALRHVDVQAAVEHADVHPAVARRDGRPRLLARAPDLIRRYPRVDEVGAQLWQLAQLLDQVLELVERRPFGRREGVERAAVGSRPEGAGLDALLERLLRGRPGPPPVHAEPLELRERGGPVDERAQLADGLAAERPDAALGDERES